MAIALGAKAEDVNGHEYVDLGLPSGTMWATCNIGANSPEEYGDYFAWGETAPKESYNWSTYFDTEDDGNTFKKYYISSGLTELQPEDDAATANWGSGWQIPSLEQFIELKNYTTSEWTTVNGIKGRKITSEENGNSIFLPAAGIYNGKALWNAGTYGEYWLRTLAIGSRLVKASQPSNIEDMFVTLDVLKLRKSRQVSFLQFPNIEYISFTSLVFRY